MEIKIANIIRYQAEAMLNDSTGKIFDEIAQRSSSFLALKETESED